MLAPYEGLTLRAIAGKVIVEPEPEPERTIAVVKRADDSFRVGRVISIGDDARKAIPDLAVGNRVLYVHSMACTTAVRERAIVHHDKVICVVDGEGGAGELAARAMATEVGVQAHRPER